MAVGNTDMSYIVCLLKLIVSFGIASSTVRYMWIWRSEKLAQSSRHVQHLFNLRFWAIHT